MRPAVLASAAAVALSGCALKGDVRRVEREVQALQATTARADSARAVELDRIIRLLDAVQDSLSVQQRRLVVLQGEVRSDVTEVQRQLVQIQELTGQSQQRLTELRRQLDDRMSQPMPVVTAPGDTAGGVSRPAGAVAGEPGPDQLYDIALAQLRRGSPQTARIAFRRFLEVYPRHARAVDALFFIGESFEQSFPDSARAIYERIANDHADAPRAPAALYRLGLMLEQRGDLPAARLQYNRLIAGYPRSEEAELARNKLRTLDR